MPTLIVRPPWAAQPAWTGAWVNAQASGQAGTLMSWDRADQLPACDELLLAVPAALLSWHALTLPKLAPGRWHAAMEGLLEERLLADAGEIHLALSPDARGGQEVQVAACDKSWLSQALAALEQAGRSVARIVPEFEPDGSGLHLLGQPERGCLVECSAQAVQCLPLSHPVQNALRAWAALGPVTEVQAEPGMAEISSGSGFRRAGAMRLVGSFPTMSPPARYPSRLASSAL